MELSEIEQAVIETIMAGDKAWSKIGHLTKAGHSLETIGDLMIREILARWDHPDDGEAVTMAPLGVYLWSNLRAETVELAERPLTIHKQKREQGEIVDVRVSDRVNFWIEGGAPPLRRSKRLVEDHGLMLALDEGRVAEPAIVMDEVSGSPVELFAGLFNGTKVKGITITVDRRVKGKSKKKGKGGAKQKRRKAG